MNKFTYIYQSSYLGRIERRAYVQFKENNPKSLKSNGLKSFSCAVVRHLLDTEHEVDTLKSF